VREIRALRSRVDPIEQGLRACNDATEMKQEIVLKALSHGYGDFQQGV
jgi:hypothetical protein